MATKTATRPKLNTWMRSNKKLTLDPVLFDKYQEILEEEGHTISSAFESFMLHELKKRQVEVEFSAFIQYNFINFDNDLNGKTDV